MNQMLFLATKRRLCFTANSNLPPEWRNWACSWENAGSEPSDAKAIRVPRAGIISLAMLASAGT